MKHSLFAMLLIALMMLSGTALGEEDIETPFDRFSKYDLDNIINMDALPIQINVETIPTEAGDQLALLGVMLVDLYDYETRILGKSVDESVAVDIYWGLQQETGIACLTAVNIDAVLVNGFFAKNIGGDSDHAQMYWFEYNLEEHTLRVDYDGIIEKGADAEDFLSEYVFAGWIFKSVGGNTMESRFLSEDSVFGAYDGKNMESFFDGIYEDLYHELPDF